MLYNNTCIYPQYLPVTRRLPEALMSGLLIFEQRYDPESVRYKSVIDSLLPSAEIFGLPPCEGEPGVYEFPWGSVQVMPVA